MTIADKAVLVTGANRGIGQALVEEALRRGAKRVYAGTRQPMAHMDGRVRPLTLDVTNAEQIQAAVKSVESLDVLINNAGIALYDDLSDLDAIGRHLAVNLFGMFNVTRAFLPLLKRSKGAIVNNLSMVALVVRERLQLRLPRFLHTGGNGKRQSRVQLRSRRIPQRGSAGN